MCDGKESEEAPEEERRKGSREEGFGGRRGEVRSKSER